MLRLVEPVYTGVSILCLSKYLAQKTYGRIKDAFPASSLLMTDTDSWYIETETPITTGLLAMRDILDTSELDCRNSLYSLKNRKIPGKLKLEYPRMQILQFVATKSRTFCFSMETHSGFPVMVAKCSGISRSAMETQCSIDDFKRCLLTGVQQDVTCTGVRTDGKHGIFTIRHKRCALSSFDDKRKLMPDLYSTEAWRPVARSEDPDENEPDENDFDPDVLAALTRLQEENDEVNSDARTETDQWPQNDEEEALCNDSDFIQVISCIEQLACRPHE